jgi:hypothetical protein
MLKALKLKRMVRELTPKVTKPWPAERVPMPKVVILQLLTTLTPKAHALVVEDIATLKDYIL